MMRTPYPCYSPSGPAAAAWNWLFQPGAAWAASLASRDAVVSSPGLLLTLAVAVPTAPGVGSGHLFTVQRNGVDSPLAVRILDNAVASTPVTAGATVTLGDADKVALAYTPIGTPASPASVAWGFELQAADSFPLVFGSNSAVSTSAANYIGPHMAQATAWETSDAAARQVIPVAGRLRRLRVLFNQSPGAGTSYVVTVYVNGVASALAVTVAGTLTGDVDLLHSVPVAAGDRVSVEVVPVGGPTGRSVVGAIEFIPSVLGTGFLAYASSQQPATSATRFQAIAGAGGSAWSASEALRQGLVPAAGYSLTGLYAEVGTAPGVGKTWTMKARRNAVDVLSRPIADNATVAAPLVQTVALSALDLLTAATTPAGTPAAMVGGAKLSVSLSGPSSPSSVGLLIS